VSVVPQRRHRSEAGQPVRPRQPLGSLRVVLKFKYEMRFRLRRGMSVGMR
jgi:hypothetical protein